jgi:hypothetical protein
MMTDERTEVTFEFVDREVNTFYLALFHVNKHAIGIGLCGRVV